MTFRKLVFGAMLALPVAGCATQTKTTEPASLPVMRWDFRPEASSWTRQTLAAVSQKDADLAALVPNDIDTWCPGYRTASMDERRAFWTAMLSALAKHESTWNPAASGGGGKWIGLVQIAPRTARAYDCDATTTSELKNGSANLACAVNIASAQVSRDNMVAGAQGRRGMGRDWAPFRSSAKRAEMAQWTRSQDYCAI
ncbi:transglycosylase SLT domain-containing protein [Falsirhodobacter halotolerans]|uniref:lytic transglycosylase domain-containing protein n=1 Tax=Falsirhodobacter halotolerans TaxID=1146892 RepID=UPI001FD550DB|nr:transglycosylase SLT domain-containing protein [Falsirhodobacter halotolerans]MCJ8139397.1 transglycosylase SLT domain-containing protein [Falsirhodobacter halotolerans]